MPTEYDQHEGMSGMRIGRVYFKDAPRMEELIGLFSQIYRVTWMEADGRYEVIGTSPMFEAQMVYVMCTETDIIRTPLGTRFTGCPEYSYGEEDGVWNWSKV